MNLTKFKNHIKSGTATVKFRKADNSIRVLECTLAPYLLPETKKTGRLPNPDVTVVYDLENDGWRSFRNDSIIEKPTLHG